MRRAAAAAIALAASLGSAGFAREAGAPAVSVRLTVPPGAITVGDPVILTLRATHPPGTRFDFPDAASALARMGQEEEAAAEPGREGAPPLAIVDEVKPIAAGTSAPGQTAWSIHIRLFKPGENRLPPLRLTFRLPGSDERLEAATEPAVLKVQSVLERPDETASGDKGPWRVPADWTVWLIGGAAALVLAAILFAIARRLRRRPRPQPAPVAPPAPAPEPPRVRALRELDRLLASTLLAEGRIKEFHVILSEIVKRYLGEEHGFDALDRTTQEVLADLTVHAPEVREPARSFLQACDLVKFAKHRPPREAIDETVREARRLIDTRRRPSVSAGAAA